MSAITKEAINLMEILPESEQNFALEFIKKLVLAWDPDFTKLTLTEKNWKMLMLKSGMVKPFRMRK